MSSFFNKKLIEGLTTGRYYCPKCGSLMKFENEEWQDTLVCPNCGEDVDLDEYGFDSEEEYEALYPTREEVLGEEDDDEPEETYDNDLYEQLDDD